MNSLAEFNLQGFIFLNHFLGHSDIVDNGIYFFAQYYVLFLVAACLWYIYYDYRHDSVRQFKINLAALMAVLVAIFSWLELVRYLFPYPRPFIALDVAHLFVVNSPSFPSGHTIFIFGMATGLYFYGQGKRDKNNKTAHRPKNIDAHKLAFFFALSGIVVGLARVASGVHYPFDIVGGAIFGVIIGIVVELVVRTCLRRL